MFSTSKKKEQHDASMYDRIHVVKRGMSFKDMLASPPDGSVKMTITPDIAAEMLRFNTRNRPASANTVEHYKRQMEAGEWRYTRVPVIFSASGILNDGQHRLLACVASNTPIVADVVFGADDESFAYIDTGKKRTAGDIFAINGVKDHNKVSAVTRIVKTYLDGYSIGNHGGSGDYTPSELYEFLKENPDIIESKSVYRAFAKNRLANPSRMAGLYVICARKNRKMADRFFSIVAEGFGAEKKNDPAMVLRKKLIDAATSGDKMGIRMTSALTITAWNRARDGLSGVGLKVDPEAPAPRIR